ncbi:hypothetical protein GCM10023063_18540 [Arthrobacter methylotrophus]|uniref:Uncharacterized protein n=1 Tax=Arthrobacter methylotrophus TaxID=121291 RepID=A0ABV5UQZ2_9MICC
MTTLTAVPSPAQIPAARQNARLYLQSRALTGIKQHLLGGGSDTEFMIRVAGNALRETAPVDSIDQETRRHTRGLEALRRHLTVGGTDRAILIGLAVNALTGYSPATVKEADELAASRKAAA